MRLLSSLFDVRILLAAIAGMCMMTCACGGLSIVMNIQASQQRAALELMTPEERAEHEMRTGLKLIELAGVDVRQLEDEMDAGFDEAEDDLDAALAEGELTRDEHDELVGTLEEARARAARAGFGGATGGAPSVGAPTSGKIELETIQFHPVEEDELSSLSPTLLAFLVAASMGGAILLAGLVVSFLLYRGFGGDEDEDGATP